MLVNPRATFAVVLSIWWAVRTGGTVALTRETAG